MSHGRKIGIIGLGYVGLPVAVAFGRVGADARRPDIRALLKASKTVGKAMRKGAIVVYESTGPPHECEPMSARDVEL